MSVELKYFGILSVGMIINKNLHVHAIIQSAKHVAVHEIMQITGQELHLMVIWKFRMEENVISVTLGDRFEYFRNDLCFLFFLL